MVTHHSHEATSQSQPAHMSTHQMRCMDSTLPSAEQKKNIHKYYLTPFKQNNGHQAVSNLDYL